MDNQKSWRENYVKKKLFLAVIAACIISTSLFAISRDTYRQIQFKIEHSGDPEVRKAGEILTRKGILKPDSNSASTYDISSRNTDCHVQFNQKFIRNILKQDMVDNKLPEQLLSLFTRLDENKIEVTGRLDGPAFINPRFSSDLDIGYLAKNSFRVRISDIRVAGFKVTLFTRLICGYIEDAIKRAFPENCKTRVRKKSGGVIYIDVKVSPEGFVPGISKLGYLSNAGIAKGRMFFSFTVPQAK